MKLSVLFYFFQVKFFFSDTNYLSIIIFKKKSSNFKFFLVFKSIIFKIKFNKNTNGKHYRLLCLWI